MATHPETCTCPRCGNEVVPDAPHWGWRVGVWLAWGMSLSMVFAMILTGIAMELIAPWVFVAGISMIGPTTREAAREPTCPRCLRSLSDVLAARRASPARTPGAARPATAE